MPDNNGGKENCLTISKGSYEIGYNDFGCSYVNVAFICQIVTLAPVTQPTTQPTTTESTTTKPTTTESTSTESTTLPPVTIAPNFEFGPFSE